MATYFTNLERRARNLLGDADETKYDDETIENAILDYLEDSITPVNGVTYTFASNGTDLVLSTELATGMSRVVAAGAALYLLRGEATRAARESITMDSPSGRVSLTERAKSLQAMMEDIEAELATAEANVEILIPGTKFVDTTGFETGRIEGSSSTASSSGA